MVIDLPIKDFLLKHEKSSSRVLNQRNLRSTIPERYSKMLKDLLERKVNEKLVARISGQVFEAYSNFGSYQALEGEKNAVRLAKVFVKLSATPFGKT
jgi:hypothetical protein